MKQHTWQLVLLVVVALIVAACSNTPTTTDVPASAEETDPAQADGAEDQAEEETDPAQADGAEDQAEVAVTTDEVTTDSSEGTTTDTESAMTGDGNPQACVDDYDSSVDYFPDKVTAEYSRQWQVEYANNYKVVTVTTRVALNHEATTNVVENTYVLVQCGTPAPELTDGFADAVVIEIPTQRIVDGEDSLFGSFELLQVADSLVAYAEFPISEEESPYLPTVYERMDSDGIPAVGYSEVNLELLAELEPDLYIKPEGDEGMFQQIRNLGIPIVFYNPYFEEPLGSAEQGKFLSLFFNQEAIANEHFTGVESRYEELRAKADQVEDRPRVLLGAMSPGRDFGTRQNDYYEAMLVRDAGGERVLDLPGYEFETIAWETVVDQGSDADFWFHLAFRPQQQNAAEFVEADPRAESIQALSAGNAFHRYGPRGQDYSHGGQINPDMVLADLISILHPDLMPDYELVFLQPIVVE